MSHYNWGNRIPSQIIVAPFGIDREIEIQGVLLHWHRVLPYSEKNYHIKVCFLFECKGSESTGLGGAVLGAACSLLY